MQIECPTPAKRRYATPQAAQCASRRQALWADGRFLRAYDCPCGWWHLTSRQATLLPAEGRSQRKVA